MKTMKFFLYSLTIMLAQGASLMPAAAAAAVEPGMVVNEAPLKMLGLLDTYLAALEASSTDDGASLKLQELSISGCQKVVNDTIQLTDCATQWPNLLKEKRSELGSWTLKDPMMSVWTKEKLATITFTLCTGTKDNFLVIKFLSLTPELDKFTSIVEFVTPLIDGAIPAPKGPHSKIFENDHFCLSRWTFAAGATTPEHSNEFPAMMVALAEGAIEERTPSGQISILKLPLHAGIYQPAKTLHTTRNAGDTNLDIVMLELKTPKAAHGGGVHAE